MSKSYEIRVFIEEVGETQEIGDKGFKKREVIGKIEGEWPQYYKFEFIKDKTSVPDDLIEGTYATVFFNLNGRKVEAKTAKDEDKYFTSLQAWKVDIG